jgi:hypothetical protein
LVQNPYSIPSNNFGIWKEYCYHPSYDPDTFISTEDLHHPHTSTIMVKQVQEEQLESSLYTNKSAALIVDWQNTRSPAKSNVKVNHLVHNVILHPDFQLDQLHYFNAAWENQRADLAEAESPLLNTFQHTDIRITIPSGNKDVSPCSFSIPGLYFHKLTTLIKELFESPLSSMFHFTPFKMYRMRPDGNGKECVFSEMYNSDVLWEEHNKVQCMPTNDLTCKQEKVIAALMFWSDTTQLASFGMAKLWPIYMLFGNLSKYVRC